MAGDMMTAILLSDAESDGVTWKEADRRKWAAMAENCSFRDKYLKYCIPLGSFCVIEDCAFAHWTGLWRSSNA